MVSARREDPVVKSGLRRRWRRRRWSLRKSGGILSIYDVISTHMNVLQILVAVNVHKQFLDSDNDNRKKWKECYTQVSKIWSWSAWHHVLFLLKIKWLRFFSHLKVILIYISPCILISLFDGKMYVFKNEFGTEIWNLVKYLHQVTGAVFRSPWRNFSRLTSPLGSDGSTCDPMNGGDVSFCLGFVRTLDTLGGGGGGAPLALLDTTRGIVLLALPYWIPADSSNAIRSWIVYTIQIYILLEKKRERKLYL